MQALQSVGHNERNAAARRPRKSSSFGGGHQGRGLAPAVAVPQAHPVAEPSRRVSGVRGAAPGRVVPCSSHEQDRVAQENRALYEVSLGLSSILDSSGMCLVNRLQTHFNCEAASYL